MEAGPDHEQYPKQAWKDQLIWGLWETTQQEKAPVTKPSDLSSNLGAPIVGGGNGLHKVVLRLPHPAHCMHVPFPLKNKYVI